MPSYCWKCGVEVPDGHVECSVHNTTQFTHSGPEIWKSIDWAKVETLDDLKRIFAAMQLRVRIGGPQWEMLREFLED